MDYQIIVRPEAEQDLRDAFSWYESHKPGLGFDFKHCVEEVLSRLTRTPYIYPKVYKQVKRAFIKRFPFGIFYVVEENRVVILAVLHARRNPEYWKKRK